MTTETPSRRTKIVATLGPATDAPGMLEKLIAEGVDVVRLNLSHGQPDDHRARANAVRAAFKAGIKPSLDCAPVWNFPIRCTPGACDRRMMRLRGRSKRRVVRTHSAVLGLTAFHDMIRRKSQPNLDPWLDPLSSDRRISLL